MTEWKRIPQLEARFQASTDAQIKTLAYTKDYVWPGGTEYSKSFSERIIRQRVIARSKHGIRQPYVSIYRGTSRETSVSHELRVAYLVASAFLGLPFDRTDQRELQRWRIKFNDGNVMNCRPENLEWVYRIGEASDGGQQRYEDNMAEWDKVKGKMAPWMTEMYAEAV